MLNGGVLCLIIGFIIGHFYHLELEKEKKIEVCYSYAVIAEHVMEGHQDGIPISTFLSINKGFDYSTRITKEAYGYPIRKTKSEKKEAVVSFKSMIEQRCLTSKKHH